MIGLCVCKHAVVCPLARTVRDCGVHTQLHHAVVAAWELCAQLEWL